jgi:hypothetical protein
MQREDQSIAGIYFPGMGLLVMLDAEKFKKRIQKEIDYSIEWISNVAPADIVRIYQNLMEHGVARILLGRELLTHFDQYEPTIREMVKKYTKFSFDLPGDRINLNTITFLTTGSGYFIGSITLIETRPHFLQIDEDFSIHRYREYIKELRHD